MINLQNLIDDAKCYEAVRQLRWPTGVRCPHCMDGGSMLGIAPRGIQHNRGIHHTAWTGGVCSGLRPHRGISQEKRPWYLGFFQFVHNARIRGKGLLRYLLGVLLA